MFPGMMRLATNCRTGCWQNVSFSRSCHNEFSWSPRQSAAEGARLLGVCETFDELLRRNRSGKQSVCEGGRSTFAPREIDSDCACL
jgi:hypothetical protein